ncbi:MAG TPA: hypothetical protein ENN12_02000 [Epsilonproteobacteria bacterium]|nr:hypothetical protein [Campylobacterota bacterium]
MIKIFLKLLILAIGIASALAVWQKEQLSIFALVQIDPLPETKMLINQEQYAQAHEYLSFFLEFDYVKNNPEAQEIYKQINKKRNELEYKAKKITQGIITGTSDETIGQVASVVSDFFVFGDIRDLTIQGINYARGEESDKLLIALSTIGIVATGAQLASATATVTTAGVATPTLITSSATKSAITTLKAAKRAGHIPPWLRKKILDIAKTSKKTKKVGDFVDIANDINKLAKTKGGIRMLKQTSDPASLKQMIQFSKTFGEHSAIIYKFGGKTALAIAKNSQKQTKHALRLATTYGKEGIEALGKMGSVKFLKYTSRASKIAYKGDALRLIAKKLLKIPNWVFFAAMALSLIVWLPKRSKDKLNRTF